VDDANQIPWWETEWFKRWERLAGHTDNNTLTADNFSEKAESTRHET